MDVHVEEIVSAKSGLKTTGLELKTTLEKTGRTIRDVNGLDKLDLLNLIVEQIKEKIECRGRMQLRLSDLNVLLQREGLSSEATAQDAIKQVLKLRCSQLARLGTYSVLPADDAFSQALALIPSNEIDNCFAYDDSAARVSQAKPAQLPRACHTSLPGGTAGVTVGEEDATKAAAPSRSCDESRYVPVLSQSAKGASLEPVLSQSAKGELTPARSATPPVFSQPAKRASTPPRSPHGSGILVGSLPKPAVHDAFCKGSSVASQYSASELPSKPLPEFGCSVPTPGSYADLEAKVAELQSRLDNAETRASLAEERAKVTMLEAQLEKADARAALAEARADALEARLAGLEGRGAMSSAAPAVRHSANLGTRPEGTTVPVTRSSTRSPERNWQWESCSGSATVPVGQTRSPSPVRSAIPGVSTLRREAFVPKVRAKPPTPEIRHRLGQLHEESALSPSGRGSPTYKRHPGNPSIPGRPLFQQLVNF